MTALEKAQAVLRTKNIARLEDITHLRRKAAGALGGIASAMRRRITRLTHRQRMQDLEAVAAAVRGRAGRG